MSGRRGLAGLQSPHPLGQLLPGPYLEDDLTQRWMAALDEVLSPVLLVLDCLDAYVDPRLTPPDVLKWLAGWVGVETQDSAPEASNRDWVASATAYHRRRGAAAAIADEVRHVTGLEVEAVDSGGTAWSPVPGGPLPGEDEPGVVVRVYADDPAAVDLPAVARVISAASPAHVPSAVAVVASGAESTR